MPRSESRIADDRAAKARCRELITRASKSYSGNVDAGAIVRQIQWHYSKQVEADRPLARYLWGKGLEPEVRSVLREWTLRRRLWPMCRGQLPEETILSATDELQQDWGVFLPDELLLPLLNQIDAAAAPRRRGPRRRA